MYTHTHIPIKRRRRKKEEKKKTVSELQVEGPPGVHTHTVQLLVKPKGFEYQI
jgi:hypothetical protein